MNNTNKSILNFLFSKGAISSSHYNNLISDNASGNILDAIISKNIISPLAANELLGEFYGLPTIDLSLIEPDAPLLHRFSIQMLSRHKIFPVSLSIDNVLTVAIANPYDYAAISIARLIHSGKIEFALTPISQIEGRLQSMTATKTTTSVLNELRQNSVDSGSGNDDETDEDVANAPAVKFVDSIIKEAIPFRASDIHIEPYEKTVRVRYRLDGSLTERAQFPIDSYPAVAARLKILSGINIAERRVPQDGRINLTLNGIEYDFRVSTLPTVYGEKFVIRILDKSAFNFTRKELGFTDEENIIVNKILSHPHGIVLLTGPTGCGKSTTLYSFLKELNHHAVNIVTVEDPVEYTLEGINQTQVNTKANMTFASALRSILRQDPNIIMIGEIRDEETAQIAIRAAITGHLVFSTLHTNDAPGSVSRLIDMGVKPYLVGDSVVGIIAQRLIKKLCPQCKTKRALTKTEMIELELDSPQEIFEPHGCPFCNNTGYKGRTAVHEIMYINNALRTAINEQQQLETIREIAIENGMKSLWASCRDLVLSGVTSLPELMALSVE